jgi:hypothetical protein
MYRADKLLQLHETSLELAYLQLHLWLQSSSPTFSFRSCHGNLEAQQKC